MNIIKAYGRGFKNSLRHPKMILLIFGITLLLGLALALPFFFSFKTAVGSSVVSKTLDFTMFKELIQFHSWNLESILSQGRFMVLIFWLLMIFFVGGIVRTFNKEDYSVSTFFAGAGVNFFRFLLCDIIMLVLQVVTAAVLFGIASFVLSLFNNVVTETPLFWAYGIAAFIFLCAIVLLLMISDYAKFYMEMERTNRVLKAIGKATQFVFCNFVKTYFLYALLLVVPLLTLVLYKLTFDKIGMSTVFGIIMMFLVQQLFIILRVWYRIWSLSSQFELFADDYVKEISFDLETSTVVTTTTTTVTTSDDSDISKIAVVDTDSSSQPDRVVIEVDTDSFTNSSDDDEATIAVVDDNNKDDEATIAVVDDNKDDEATIAVFDDNNKDNESTIAITTNDNDDQTTETTTKTTVIETVVINDNGDTFSKVVEEYTNADSDSQPEPESDDVDTETLEQFYANDQDGDTSTNLVVTSDSDKDESAEDAVSSEQSTVVETTTIKTTTTTVETTTESGETVSEPTETTKTTVVETEVINNDGDTFSKVVEEYTDADTDSTPEPESDDVDTETLEQFYANDQDSDSSSNLAELNTDDSDGKSDNGDTVKIEVIDNTGESKDSSTEPETKSETVVVSIDAKVDSTPEPDSTPDEEPGDVDEDTLLHFYDTDEQTEEQHHENDGEDFSKSNDRDVEVVDIDDVDESIGSSVSLDVEDDDDMVTTVTTTTVTTTTTTTTTTSDTAADDDDQPKIIKIYTEQEMREIAKQQQENAGFKPDIELTEIVSEDVEDGEPSGEKHQAEQFVKKGLEDGKDANDPHTEALG